MARRTDAGRRPAARDRGLALVVTVTLGLGGCTGAGGLSTPGTAHDHVPTATTPAATAPASPATPTASPTRTGPAPATESIVFGDPWSSDYARVHSVVESAIDLIDATSSGDTIRVTVFNLTSPAARQALVDAYDRGVHVRVVVNARAAHKKEVRKLRAALGTRTSASSWVVVRAGDVRMHSKFLLVQGDGKAPVVWVSSGNFTNADGRDQANAALITTGDQALFDFLAEQFTLLSRSVTDPVRLGRTATTATATISTYPVATGGPSTDPVQAILDNVTCRHGEQHTTIRLAQLMFKAERGYLAGTLRKLKEDGCAVIFLGHTKGFSHSVISELTRSGKGRIDLRDITGYALHTKITSVDGWDAGGRPIKVALVGTHNLSGRALAFTPHKGVNDELAMRITNAEIVDACNDWIDQLRRDHSYSVR